MTILLHGFAFKGVGTGFPCVGTNVGISVGF